MTMVPVVELRVWTRYPGQFRGQVPVRDRASYMLTDPTGHLSALIKRSEELTKQCAKNSLRTDFLPSLRAKWLAWASKRLIKRLASRTKRALSQLVVTSNKSARVLESHEKHRVVQSMDRAVRLDFVAYQAKEPFDGETLLLVAYASTVLK